MAKRMATFISAGLLALAATTPAAARDMAQVKPETVGLSAERLARIDAAMARDIAAGSKVGAVIAVARHGKIAYLKAFGMADREQARPMATNSFFRLFSETKPMVSVALLMLYEEGRFALTDPLDMYIPEFATLRVYDHMEGDRMVTRAPKRKPTIHDVFRHTAGFSGGILPLYNGPVDQAWIKMPPAKSLQELVARTAAIPLAYEPGTEWRYGPEHDIQAHLVEKLSGMSIDAFLRTRLFAPLGMTETFYKVPASAAGRMTVAYEFDGKGGTKIYDRGGLDGNYVTEARAFQRGGSGITSTARDQLRFGQMLLNGGELDGVRILSRKTVGMMLSDQLPAAVKEVTLGPGSDFFPGYRYGLGIAVLGDVAAGGNLASAGVANWAGFANTDLFVDPKEDMQILVWTQSRPGDYRWMYGVRTLAYQALVD